MKNKVKFFGIIALIAVIGFGVIGCNDNPSSSSSSQAQRFSVSGTFNRGGDDVKFNLQEGTARAASAKKSLSGFLEDGDFVIRLNGTYDSDTGSYSASAAGSVIRYSISGVKDADGNNVGQTATVTVKSGDEWVATTYIITPVESVNINTSIAVNSQAGGIPAAVQGVWRHSEKGTENNISWSWDVTATVNQWDVDFLGIYKQNGNTSTESVKATLIEIENPAANTYDVIYAFPAYLANETYAKAAVQDFFSSRGSSIGYFQDFDPENNWPQADGLYYYLQNSGPTDYWPCFIGVNISPTTWKLVDQFYFSNALEKYLISKGVSPVTLYQKAQFKHANNKLTWTQYKSGLDDYYFLTFSEKSAFTVLDVDGEVIVLER
jgi:hypothetical protein